MEGKVEFYKETEFKDTEIGRIPKDWELKKLNDIVKIESGKRERGGGKGNGEVLSLGGENISPVGKLILDSPKYISKKFYNSLKLGRVKEKDILFVKDGATTGKVAFIDELPTNEVAVNEHLFIIRNKTNNVDQKFLYYIMTSNIFQNQIKSVFHGIIGGITKLEMEEFYVPLPPLEEQQKIAEILSNIDEAIQKTDDIISKTESLKKGLMQELLTKGIGHKEFKDTEIGKIPKDWEAIRFGDIVNLVKGRRPKEFVNERIKDSLPYLSAENLRNNNAVQFVKVSDDIILVDDGDLILIWDGSNAGEFFLGKRGVLSSTMVKILLKEKLYHGRFLFYLLKTKENYLKDQTKGTGIPHVDGTILRSLVIPLPTLKEQQKIAEILSTIDKKLEVLKQEKVKFEKIKQWFMDKLLTGRIRVRIA